MGVYGGISRGYMVYIYIGTAAAATAATAAAVAPAASTGTRVVRPCPATQLLSLSGCFQLKGVESHSYLYWYSNLLQLGYGGVAALRCWWCVDLASGCEYVGDC